MSWLLFVSKVIMSHFVIHCFESVQYAELHCTLQCSHIQSSSSIRACSHEPGTVNYPWVMIAPGQALPRVHMMICCPGATFPRVKFIAPGQVHRHPITTNLSEFGLFLQKLLQRMNFKHVYLFLVLSGTFDWKI